MNMCATTTNADSSPARNIASLLWRAADRRPDALAVADAGSAVSYRELVGLAAAHAAQLVDAGVRPDDRVAVHGRRSAPAIAAIFGTFAMGAVAVIVPEALRRRQVDHIEKVTRPAAAILTEDGLGVEGPGRSPTMPVLRPAAAATPWRVVPRVGSDIAQLIFTSGSTGQPKGVAVSHANLREGVRAVGGYLHLRPTDRIAALLPLAFDYGLSQVLLALATGAAVVVERAPAAPRVDAALRSAGVTVAAGVPSTWQRLLGVTRFREEPIESLRIMTNTGGALMRPTVRRLRSAQPQAELFAMYGLTEAFRSTFLAPDQIDRKPTAVGRAIPGAEVVVRRPDGSPCDPLEIGEIVHRGPTVALGYWQEPAATERVFRQRESGSAEREVWTGDFGWKDEDGDLHIQGRRDGVFKRYGYRMSRDGVADAIAQSGMVSAVAITVGDEPDLPTVIAHVVLAPGATAAALETWIVRELPAHVAPTAVSELRELPLTGNGKPDLAALALRASDDRG